MGGSSDRAGGDTADPGRRINSHEKVAALLSWARRVRSARPFAVTEESDAHPKFSASWPRAAGADHHLHERAGLPARAVLTRGSSATRDGVAVAERAGRFRDRCASAFNCLSHCGLRDGIAKMGPVLHRRQLAAR